MPQSDLQKRRMEVARLYLEGVPVKNIVAAVQENGSPKYCFKGLYRDLRAMGIPALRYRNKGNGKRQWKPPSGVAPRHILNTQSIMEVIRSWGPLPDPRSKAYDREVKLRSDLVDLWKQLVKTML